MLVYSPLTESASGTRIFFNRRPALPAGRRQFQNIINGKAVPVNDDADDPSEAAAGAASAATQHFTIDTPCFKTLSPTSRHLTSPALRGDLALTFERIDAE